MFILICRYNRVFADPGDDVTLSAHLSPETSAVPMEVRWFRGMECVYLYKNGQKCVGRGYEDRASIFTQELQMGNVSLMLKDVRQMDTGIYCCQVLTDQNKVEKSVHLYMSGMEPLSPDPVEPKLWEQDQDESHQLLELKKLLRLREEELQIKTKELEKATEILRNNSSLLQYKDSDLEKMSKLAKENEGWMKDVSRELAACRAELEQLRLNLQDKDEQGQQLTALLQDRELLLTELKALLHNKEKELQAKALETESISAELNRMGALLQHGDTYVQTQVEERVRNMAGEVELCKTELESLRRELLEKSNQVKQLQARGRELEERLSAGENRSCEVDVASYEAFVAELLEKTGAMLSRMYQNRDEQLAEIERWIHEKREEKRAIEEENVKKAVEKQFNDFAADVYEAIEEEHDKILNTEKAMATLEDELQRAGIEQEREELKTELQGAQQRREAAAQRIEQLSKDADEQREMSEGTYRRVMEVIRERYNVLPRVEAETGILKMVLPEVQNYFRGVAADMRGFLERQGEMRDGDDVKAKRKKRVQFKEIVTYSPEKNSNPMETERRE